MNYEYDENGMRYRTTVLDKEANQETVYEYVWADGKLVSLVYFIDEAQCTAKYLYNEFDEPVGMVYTDESNYTNTYYYLKNAQGDITCIVDSSGEKIISLSYDAFGKVSAQYHLKNSLSTVLGMVELIVKKTLHRLVPFGYRGYCYDTFTELYYLQSRYYDPNTGRFINADDTNYLNATGTVLGCNLFAYCENDAVNKVDESGNCGTPIQWACAIIGALLGIPFGRWLANKLGYSSGWKYYAIRAAAIVGGAALGWFAGSYLIKLVKSYLINHPETFLKIQTRYGAKALLKFKKIFGLDFSSFGSKYVAKFIVRADRVGSALKNDIYHRAASWLSETQLSRGRVFRLSNGRTLLQVYGKLNGKKGVFEYILDELGRVCHEIFKEGGVINGKPN